jgi:predicted RNA polymerase sigma factor
VGLAEDLASGALVDALTQWPDTGVPRNAGAWLTTVAKRKAIDDDVLRLIFIAAHPVLPDEGRIALTLRVVGGLTTDEIAHAFLVPKATVAQRIVRAKKTLADAQVPFEVPDRSEYPNRMSAVLSVIYLIFNEGYTASSGQRWIRDELGADALRLGRVLAALMPDEPEVHGLVSLMEFQSSRFAARTDADGRPVLLADQDRSRWDRAQINRGVAGLARAPSTPQRHVRKAWGPTLYRWRWPNATPPPRRRMPRTGRRRELPKVRWHRAHLLGPRPTRLRRRTPR